MHPPPDRNTDAYPTCRLRRRCRPCQSTGGPRLDRARRLRRSHVRTGRGRCPARAVTAGPGARPVRCVDAVARTGRTGPPRRLRVSAAPADVSYTIGYPPGTRGGAGAARTIAGSVLGTAGEELPRRGVLEPRGPGAVPLDRSVIAT